MVHHTDRREAIFACLSILKLYVWCFHGVVVPAAGKSMTLYFCSMELAVAGFKTVGDRTCRWRIWDTFTGC